MPVLLVCQANASVVFSEIMYHPADAPDGTDGDLFEYIELYNNGALPETLTGAYFSKGISYTFTNAIPTVLNPGDYLVVVKDRTAFQSRYPGVTNLAPYAYSGKLDNDGEKVTLKIGAASVSITYGTTNAWPSAADGFGPSLERFCLTAAGDDSSVNWSASCAPTNWQQVAWTGRFDSASIPIAFFLDFDGKCLLDDVSVKTVGSDVELVTNGPFDSGLTGWSVTNSHSQSRVEAGRGSDGGPALAIQCNESRWYLDKFPYSVTFTGDAYSNRVVSVPVPVVPEQDYAVSWRVQRAGMGGTLYSVMGGITNSLTLSSLGTPGSANTVSTSFLPIGVTNVTQSLTLCPVGGTNVVRAQVSAPAEVGSVTVFYQVVGTNQYRFTNGSYSNVAMRDDGVAPDTTAGDGTYAAFLPPVHSNLNLVRYHVIATALNGFQARSPRRDDPSTDYAYWVQSSLPQTGLPNWHLLVDGTILYPYSRHLCAVSPEGQIFTDILAKHRGNEDGSNLDHSALGIHFLRTKKYNAWFANGQGGINIRHRFNNINYYYRRLVAEPLAYDLQRTLGLPSPRLRFICAWINGFPTITTELESPEEAFLSGNGISISDYVSRQSYSEGRETVAGDEALDNFPSVRAGLDALTSANRTEFIRTNLCYESIQHSLALLSVTGNGDQHIDWNMMQHRAAADGRWRQYPWDTDISFDITFSKPWTALTNLHPYYKTPLHPSIWSTNSSAPLGRSLFYPETNDVTTLPYRYRQQTTLWRYCHTLFTTNFLFPKLDSIQATLTPAYLQIGAFSYPGNTLTTLSNQVKSVKSFIVSRRDFLMNGDWSDKMADIWAPANTYDPSTVVISEIMHAPLDGIKYIELFNCGTQSVDLTRWSLHTGSFSAALPFGTMVGPTSFVVFVASQTALTNAFSELGNPSRMVERYTQTRIWDWPLVFTSATEYASRVVELAGLFVPPYGGTVELRDVIGTLIDGVNYANTPPWPDGFGVSIERIDPNSGDLSGSAWRNCTVIGTPGSLNSATADTDLDTLPDVWEKPIIAASGGALTSVSQVLPGDDFDNDTLSNLAEFLLGTNPVIFDPELAGLMISSSLGQVVVSFPTVSVTGSAYDLYSGRFYSLLNTTNLLDSSWNRIPAYSGLPPNGTIAFTNAVLKPFEAYRFEAELRPIRP
jgi:hypothetical protein